MRDYEPYFTEDGSIGLYSYAEKDVFHSKFGALTEAWEKFVLPANLDIYDFENLKVLDVCYGIGYNTKALMSFLINNIKFKKKNIFQKLFYIVAIGINKIFIKNKWLLSYIESVSSDKKYSFQIDCLDINEELVQLSPLFRTVKTPGEIYDSAVPQILTCFESYYTIRNLFVDLLAKFMPKNKKEINELLDLKFKNMHIEKEYKINSYVNYILLNNLSEYFGKEYPSKELKKMIREKKNRRFFDNSLIKYAKFNQKWGYNKSSGCNLSTFLHNIYYATLSRRYKKMNFKTAQSLFNINFYVDDARKTILTLNNEYDLIFLDAFTYTKAPQLWTVEFLAELYKRISQQGLLMTYSTSALVRNTLLENKFYVGNIYHKKTNKIIGTIASKDKTKIEHPLTPYEIGLCNTKAGIPYHDPNLSFDKKDIIEFREYEFRHSDLMSSSKYMKLRSMKKYENEEI